jgi:hypothetical protein
MHFAEDHELLGVTNTLLEIAGKIDKLKGATAGR